MELSNIFKKSVDQQAFNDWIEFMKSNDIWMQADGIENIIEAQSRTVRPHLHGYTYGEYFLRATWDKNMPPIDQVQIFEMPTYDSVFGSNEIVIPSIDTIFPESNVPVIKPKFGPKFPFDIY